MLFSWLQEEEEEEEEEEVFHLKVAILRPTTIILLELVLAAVVCLE
jgi:hypothetical protein